MNAEKFLGKKIQECRKAKGLSQEALALLVGYKDKSTISLIESANRPITIEKLIKIAETLETSIAYLLGYTSNPDMSDTQFQENFTSTKIGRDDIIIPHLDTSPASPDQIRTIAANTGDADGNTLTSDFPDISEEQKKRNRLAYKILDSDYSADEIDKIEAMIDLWTNK